MCAGVAEGSAAHNERVRVLRSFGWVLVYVVVVPVTPLLLLAIVSPDRQPDPCIGLCFSQKDGLLLLASFYGWYIAPFLVGVAAITIVAAAFVPRLRFVPAYGLAGLGALVAVIVVLLGWVIRYPDQVRTWL